MNLWDLLTGVPIRYASADLPRDVTGAGYDSHTIRPGQVFVAIHGANADGHDYTAQARQRGAACAVSAHPVEGLPYVLVPDPRRALALMAGNFFRHPDRELSLIGVTGTNGKTSVAWLTAGLFQALGIPTGLMGTNGCRIGGAVLPSRRTTPESWEVQGLLRQMADSGCTHAVMEVSSHALALDRVHGLAYTIAAFTNLSRDHLDFHGAMEDYAAAKAALFRQCRAAAVNRDDPWTERILRDCACPVYDYGLHGGRLLAEDMDLSPTGVRFTAREGEVSCPVSVSIPGLFTVYNALAALSMARLSGISLPDAAGALAKVPAVPGRMEPVSAPGLGCRIFIDFAHTPEDLAKALEMPEADVNRVLELLVNEYDFEQRGFCLKRFGKHVQLATRAIYADWVERLLQPVQKQSLSQAAMETLAVVAYRQPVTRAEVEQIREQIQNIE